MSRPDILCHYCGRVMWGSMVYIGNEHYRHETCEPGTEAWAEYYGALPADKRTDAGDILFKPYRLAQEKKQLEENEEIVIEDETTIETETTIQPGANLL